MEYTKEFKERDELLQQLEERGLAVPDRGAALNFLTRVGYFRSGAYTYVFRRLLPADQISEDCTSIAQTITSLARALSTS